MCTRAWVKSKDFTVDRKDKRVAACQIKGESLNASVDGYRRQRPQLRVDHRKSGLSPVTQKDFGARIRHDGAYAIRTAASRGWRGRWVFDLQRIDVIDMPIDDQHTIRTPKDYGVAHRCFAMQTGTRR